MDDLDEKEIMFYETTGKSFKEKLQYSQKKININEEELEENT